MALDLGKQVGPLPLGAWVAVVAGGFGIAVYTKRNSGPPLAEVVDNTSGDAGVGTGAVGGFLPTSPVPSTPTGAGPITTNEEWAVNAERVLIGKNYPPTTVDSMVRKYIAGATSTMGPAEFALLAVALADPLIGPAPQPLPPDGNPPVIAPPTGTTPPTTTAPVHAVMQTIPVGRSMYDAEKSAHPTSTAPVNNNRALIAIHYNMAHGINPWPTGVPGPLLTQWKFKRQQRVWVV